MSSLSIRPDVRIDYLANHPAALEPAADWLHRQWLAEWGWSRRQAIAELGGRLSRSQPPLALVALAGLRPVGVASLIELERPDAKGSVCCLAGLYVRPGWRRRGIGQRMCHRAIEEARRLQRPCLGLFTQGGEAFYAEMGWQKVMEAVPPKSGERSTASFMEMALGTVQVDSKRLVD